MINIDKLKNGIRVVVEEMPYYKSVAVGFWIRTGSVDEDDDNNGISHFIEHMCFKGTKKRTALEIASDMDSIGAQINAFTSKECTCYHAKATAEKLEQVIDVLSDLVTGSVFDKKEMEKERGVIIEEINMSNDSPEDLAHETISETFFSGNPIGRPILGTVKNVKSFSRDDLFNYIDSNYNPGRIVISVAGGVKTGDVMKLLEKYMGAYRTDSASDPVDPEELEHTAKKQFVAIKRDTEQIQICLALNGYSFLNPKRYALTVVNNAFGGTMSSRLFQKIREERGLAYSVYSYNSAYTRTGMFSIYAGTSSESGADVTKLLLKELERLVKDGITKEEFTKSREQLKGGYILSMESTGSKMNQNGKNLTLRNKIVTEDEELDNLAGVTLDGCMDVCRTLFKLDDICATYVGKIGDEDKLKKLIYS